MSVRVVTQQSGRFIDPWSYITFTVTGAMFLIWLGSFFMGKMLIATTLNIAPDEITRLKPVAVKASPIGALRIDAQAILPENRWLTYEVQLSDQQGNLLASGIKHALNESGTWYEDGESGSWQESDLYGGLDVRSKQDEVMTIAIQVLDYTDTSGQEINQPVQFKVVVRSGVVDGRYLWAGLIGAVSLAVLSLLAVPLMGAKVIDKTIRDSDVGDRAVVGGRDRLIRLTLNIQSDGTSPREMQVKLFVKDGDGEQLYVSSQTIRPRIKRDGNGNATGAKAKLTVFFQIEQRQSVGFYAEVIPDSPVDETRLIVRDGAKTLTVNPIVQINAC